MTERQRLNELKATRAQRLAAAQQANEKNDQAAFTAEMDQVKALNRQIDELDALVREMDRYAAADAPRVGLNPDKHDLREMGETLRNGGAVKLDLGGRVLNTNTTLAVGTLVEPTGGGADIRDGFAAQTGTLLSQVSALRLDGLGAYDEPYVVADMAAQAGAVTTLAGTARTASDPTFAKAHIAPYEVDVTSLVDRNISRLSPAAYAAKIQQMALRALRRKVTGLIINGDSGQTQTMYGMLTGVNSGGTAIYSSVALGTAIGVDTVEKLVYGYGGDEEVGGNARLILKKADLQAIGALRGTNEKGRLFEIIPDAGNANTGVIRDGGLTVPYTISSLVPNNKLIYGDPANYLLGLFGDFTIRVDSSAKAIERMDAILGDVFVGGNIVVHHGFAVGTVTPSN